MSSKFRADSADSAAISEYTSKRLEELRARRSAAGAAAATSGDSYAEYKARREAREKENGISPTTTASSTVGASSTTSSSSSLTSANSTLDYVSDTVRMRRPIDTTTSSDSKPLPNPKPASLSSTSSVTSSYKDRTDSSSGKPKKDGDEFVGFASLPEQVHRKAVKRGFDFTLMVVGESGLGKSTLISSLFLSDLYKDRFVPGVEERIARTVEIEKKYMEIEERGVKLRLTIVDTPGFNDAVDGEKCWKPIEDYINAQFSQYYNDETGLNRKNIKDNRVHCCLYFVSPFGHGLRQVDIEFMKHLHDKVNIVPIVAKADTLTPREVRKMKDTILEQVEKERIHIYEFPECDSDEDEDFKKQDQELKASIPFSVIGSNTVVEVNGKKVRGRMYPWGIVEVDNPAHCDFGKLRLMLISTHMQDLKDVTRDIHYENFRARIVKEQMVKNQRERNNNQDGKLKRDSSPNFEAIMDADSLLEQKDEEIRRMQMMLVHMQKQLKATGGQVNGLGNL